MGIMMMEQDNAMDVIDNVKRATILNGITVWPVILRTIEFLVQLIIVIVMKDISMMELLCVKIATTHVKLVSLKQIIVHLAKALMEEH